MSDLEPRTAYLPDRTDAPPSFTRLAARTATLTASALALREGLWELRQRMETDADDAARLAELCQQAEVEPRFVALITEASGALRAVAEASGELADAADHMEAGARDLHDSHQAEYAGVYEAVQASGVQQARPGFYRTR
ncbi:conjugal transfer protein TraB [Streptomyces sp. TRM43335]|uniref:Conjugal transfer protein TraB n=1 Tax=Streptomyces taklimakanensis TaxID=2569853 RepID=A0A6G2BK02_9ACTN|nr:conjugal transfer protein TraB [Streptomyces taklimakanensis]